MGYARQLVDPWALLLAASASGVAWAIHLPAAGAIAVGGAVLLGRAALSALADGGGGSGGGSSGGGGGEPDRPEVEVAAFSAEADWLRRASAAEHDFAAAAAPSADLSHAVADTVDSLYRLAGRITVADRAMAAADDETRARLAGVRDRLVDDLERGTVRLESLVARAGVEPAVEVREALGALRSSLAETEESTRRVVGA